MAVRVAINGFGRIGRNILRAIAESGRKDIEVVGINDLGPVETNAHLLRFNSVHGRFPGVVTVDGNSISLGNGKIKVTAVKDPSTLPWKDLGVDIALECTGIFTAKDKASAHLTAGAERVLVSAPADNADLTVVYGVNHDKLTKDHLVVSNASCTTNCLAPVAKVLNDAIGIETGFMTTIHAYTGDQPTLDTMHKDLYRGRAASLSMIPTSTGAAKAIGLVLPELKGKLDGVSIRVPTPNVSVIDLKIVAKKQTTPAEINEAMKRAASQQLKGILGITDAPNVSIDFNHDPHSATFHMDQTKVMNGTLVRVMAWYDNEWGFSNRMSDTAVAMGKLILTAMSGAFRTLNDVSLAGKRVLVRVDLNVPMENGKVSDTTRIDRAAPTLKEISDKGGKAIVLSHFGRPKGRDPKDSLKPLVHPLSHAIGKPVVFAEDCTGEAAQKAVAAMKNGDVLLLENTRFHAGEEKNDKAFVAELARLGDIYVNDAFSAAHRAHASTEGLGHVLPAYAGRSMQAELTALDKALGAPKKPVIAIVGGAKVSTKLDLLENLVARVDALVIGGGMANTFLHAQGIGIGKSLAERDLADTARRILVKAERAKCSVILPVDAVVAYHFAAGAPSHAYGLDAIPADGMILDIGPQSISRIRAALDDAATLVWNGPLGAFELQPFDRGTVAAAQYASERTKAGKLVSVAGGGDTVSALNQAGVADDFTYVSTAGGAFLEWMEGKKLPGVEVLKG